MAFPTAEKLEELLAPFVAEFGLDIEELKANRSGKHSAIVIAVDGDQRPTLEDLEQVSVRLSERLDALEADGTVDLGNTEYRLEVTTPGIDMPLTQPRHYKRNRGRLVQVRTQDGDQVVGHIAALNDEADTVAIVVNKGGKGQIKLDTVALPLAQVQQAVVQVEFSAPAAAIVSATEQPFEALVKDV